MIILLGAVWMRMAPRGSSIWIFGFQLVEFSAWEGDSICWPLTLHTSAQLFMLLLFFLTRQSVKAKLTCPALSCSSFLFQSACQALYWVQSTKDKGATFPFIGIDKHTDAQANHHHQGYKAEDRGGIPFYLRKSAEDTKWFGQSPLPRPFKRDDFAFKRGEYMVGSWDYMSDASLDP